METNNVRYLSAVLFVRDIAAAKRFYMDLLGMEIDLDFGTNVGLKGGLTLWQLDPGQVLPRRLGMEATSDRKTNRFELYFEAADTGVVLAKLKASGTEFLHEMEEEPYGQLTMRVFDPDRHLIEIAETMEAMVRRMHAGGLTPEQVSQKSAIPLDRVEKYLGG